VAKKTGQKLESAAPPGLCHWGLAVLHYAWSLKVIYSVSGDVFWPQIAGIILALLLFLRLPVIRRWIARRPLNTIKVN